MNTDHGRVVGIRSAGMLVGVPLERVQEVTRLQGVTRVPPAPEVVWGIANLRGNLITLLDLSTLLCGVPTDDSSEAINMIVEHDSESIGLVADELVGVFDTHDRVRQVVPTHPPNGGRELFECVVQIDDRVMMVLDLNATIKLSLERVG